MTYSLQQAADAAALPAILLRLDALAGKIDALINGAQLTGKT